MALVKFRAPALPNAPVEYDPQYIRQLIRVLEVYFSQLDSNIDNYANSYKANYFVATGMTTADKNALDAVAGTIVFDTDLAKLCVYSGSGWQTITSV